MRMTTAGQRRASVALLVLAGIAQWGGTLEAAQLTSASRPARAGEHFRAKGAASKPPSRSTPRDAFSVVVVNAASYLPGVSPGAVATIFGPNLSSVSDIVSADTNPLPTQLLDISVVVNGVYAPLFNVAYANGEDQISFQVPYETPVGPNAVDIQVLNNGNVVATLQSDSFTEDPGIFLYGNNYAVAVRYPDYQLIGPDSPAYPGDILIVYTTGLGPLTVPLLDGYGAPSDPLAYTQEPFEALINGESCQILFSGLAPGFVGLDQINLVVPEDAPAGDLNVQISTPYATSGVALLAVQ